VDNIIATSPAMVELLETIPRIADSPASVLLTGESGTGKDLIAHALHFQSHRATAPFVPINCAAIPDNLLESELFGHLQGAFTDARANKTGLFQAANGGTLFLDEIGEMPMPLQAKLLSVIESKRVRPLGATSEIAVDFRVVAATNSELEAASWRGAVENARFHCRRSQLRLADVASASRAATAPALESARARPRSSATASLALRWRASWLRIGPHQHRKLHHWSTSRIIRRQRREA